MFGYLIGGVLFFSPPLKEFFLRIRLRRRDIIRQQDMVALIVFIRISELLTPKGISFGDINTSSLFLLLPIIAF